jgi:hypothetical protein
MTNQKCDNETKEEDIKTNRRGGESEDELTDVSTVNLVALHEVTGSQPFGQFCFVIYTTN